MRKVCVLVGVVAVLAGCMSTPRYSTSFGEAHPQQSYANSDGSILFEFKFILDPFDARQAMKRIDEYLVKFAHEKGFGGYDVESVNDRAIKKTDTADSSWVDPATASFHFDGADIVATGGRPLYGLIRVRLKFTT